MSVAVGDVLPEHVHTITRGDLVRYAGASGDFNVIHWNGRVAQAVGLPDVIAHGMLTMALAGRAVTDWLDDPADLLEFGVRFTRPVPVPDDDQGATVVVSARVTAVNDDGTADLAITATHEGSAVLGRASARVRPPA